MNLTEEDLKRLGHDAFLRCKHSQPWPVWIEATERMQDENANLWEVIAVAKKYVDSFNGRTVGGRTHDFLQEFKLVYGVHGLGKKAGDT